MGIGQLLRRRRHTGRPWPRGFRWLCRRVGHTSVPRIRIGAHPGPGPVFEASSHPCRYVIRCTTCGKIADSGERHDPGPRTRAGDPCVLVAICRRCGHEDRLIRHRIRTVIGVDHPCDVEEVCDDCDHRRLLPGREHDPDPDDWRGACRRCGDWDDIGD